MRTKRVSKVSLRSVVVVNGRILAVTAQEMNIHGLKFTMDDIASRLGMSKKTLYKLFRSKDELVLSVIKAGLEAKNEDQMAILGQKIDLRQKITDFLKVRSALFEFPTSRLLREINQHHPEASRIVQKFSEERTALLKQLLDDAVKEKVIVPFQTGLIADLLTLLSSLILTHHLPEKYDLSFAETLTQALEVFSQGLLIPPEYLPAHNAAVTKS